MSDTVVTLYPRLSPMRYANKIRKGKDGRRYISKIKHGVFQWRRIKTMEETKTGKEYWAQFPKIKSYKEVKKVIQTLKVVKKELRSRGIFLYRVGWNKVWNWIDNAWSKVESKLRRESKVKRRMKEHDLPQDHVSVIFWTVNGQYSATQTGQLNLQHSILSIDKAFVVKTFRSHFDSRYQWNESSRKTIKIKI